MSAAHNSSYNFQFSLALLLLKLINSAGIFVCRHSDSKLVRVKGCLKETRNTILWDIHSNSSVHLTVLSEYYRFS